MEDKTASQRNHLTSLFSPTNLIKPFKVEYLVPKLRSVQTFENETFRVYKKVSEYFLSHFFRFRPNAVVSSASGSSS
jgi:hypothetical protein